MSVRVLNAEPEDYSEEARAILLDIGELVEESVAQEFLADRMPGFDVLIVRLGLRVTRAVIEAGDHLKAVVTTTTGLDHIDLDAAAERGVAVLSLHGETDFLRSITATAEHTWALLLALVRRIPWAFESACRGEWNRNRFRGRDLRGRHLGILGLGRIGEQVARYGLAFDMMVSAYDPFREAWIGGVQRPGSLEGLLRRSEVLSVHVPLVPETRGLLNKERLALLPRGALVVNTARGATIDESALVDGLTEGRLGGAAVDVLTQEQIPERRAQSPLVQYAQQHDNLLITPHLGGATWEAMRRAEIFTAEKLSQFLTTPRL